MEKLGYISEIKEHTDINVNRCYQCGKCSAGCAVNDEMDYPPSMVMRMLQTNDEENYKSILQSESIWLCITCQNCVTRCPMQIDIPRLMDYMREQAIEKKMVSKKAKNIVSFHKSFLDPIRLTGRSYEIGLVAGYKMRTFNLFQDLDVAPGMFLKGKLPILPERIEGRKQMKNIFQKTRKEDK